MTMCSYVKLPAASAYFTGRWVRACFVVQKP